MKYLYLARKRGAKVAVVNPLREPGLERYWVPSNVESAMFGTKMTDEFFAVHTGGDVAFVNGVLKVLLADGTRRPRLRPRPHRRASTSCSPSSSASRSPTSSGSRARPAPTWSASPGCTARPSSAVLVWSMGITQHEHGADNVAAIVNLGLARGNVGRPGAGLMPIRGHSGVQGGAEMGAYATAFPGGVDDRRRATPPRSPSSTASRSATGPGSPPRRWSRPAAAASSTCSTRRAATSSRCCPIPTAVEDALARVPLRVHQDIVVSSQMLVDPGDVVVLLPAATRYEQRDGGTETTTERRIAFSPEIPGPRPGEARSEWEIFVDLARRVASRARRPVHVRVGPGDPRRDRARRARRTRGSSCSRTTGDAVQWGGTRLCEGGDVPDARRPGALPRRSRRRSRDVPDGQLRAQHPPRQAVQHDGARSERDPLTGAIARRAVHGAVRHRARSGSRDGDRVVVRSEHGEMPRAAARRADCDPATCRCSSPRATCCCAPGGATRRRASPTTTRSSPSRRRRGDARRRCSTLFDVAAAAQRGALAPLGAGERRARTDRPGQYRLDLVADAAVLPVLARGRPARAERGVGVDRARRRRDHRRRRPGRRLHQLRARASRTGRSRCARSTPTARCARSCRTAPPARATPRCAARARTLDGAPLAPSAATERRATRSSRSSGWPPARARVAAVPRARLGGARALRRRRRHLDGYLDGHPDQHAPWDYLGGAARVPARRARSSSTPTAATSSIARRRRAPPAGRRRDPGAARRAARRDAADDRSTSISTRCSTPRAAAAAAGRRDRARRVRRRAQRPREGPGRLGERRRHRERARGPRACSHDAAPELAFFGEESGGERADVGWFVDPLDGTANFVHGFPVGRRVGRRWSPTASRSSAWCTRRCSGDMYCGAPAAAARSATASRIRVSDRDRRARRSARPASRSGPSATGSPEYFPVFERALLHLRGPAPGGRGEPRPRLDRGRGVRRLLRAGLGTWDVAAGALLVREAGGVVTDWQGDDRAWLAVGRHRRRARPACTSGSSR